MSQLAVVTDGQPPVVAQDLAQQYAALVASMNEGVGGTLNFIRPGKIDFTLVEGGNKRQVPNGQVAGVLLAVSPHDFCTWYQKSYTVGQEPEEPDLVWNWPDHNQFPDALPQELRKKQLINGKERWAFRVARRSVWALFSNVNGQAMLNLSAPYILDMTSMSLYGQGNPQANMYKYSGLMSLCQRMSGNGFICSPAMFLTAIVIDPQSPVSGVVNFCPQINNGQLAYLDNNTFQQVLQLALSQQVKDMLMVKEKLEWKNGSGFQASPTPAPEQAVSASVTPSTVSQPISSVPPSTVSQLPGPSIIQPQPQPQPVQPQPATPITPSEDLLAQAQVVMDNFSQPQQVQIPVTPGINPTTANAIAGFDKML